MAQNEGFFAQIEHRGVPWGDGVMWVPVFYQDAMSFGALFLVPTEKLKALMPSARMHPLRITPRSSVLSLSVNEFQESDLGPYNEVSIAIPFALDKASSRFTGLLRRWPVEKNAYIHHLPVNTEIARAAGVEFAGYPKILASIEFEHSADWVTCRLAQGERHILTFAGRKLDLRDVGRSRMNLFTCRDGMLLRSESLSSERQLGASRNPSDLELELGEHPIADELRDLGIGRLLSYSYAPGYQIILTPVIESFAQ